MTNPHPPRWVLHAAADSKQLGATDAAFVPCVTKWGDLVLS